MTNPLELGELLSAAEEHIHNRNAVQAFQRLGPDLTELALRFDTDEARAEMAYSARAHPVFDLILEDPYSRRAYEKPRGYAGDAVMLDYVYEGAPPMGTSSIGQTVYQGTALGPMGLSVSYRRELLAAYIDSVLCTAPEARILSVGAGHCRELTASRHGGGAGAEAAWELIALDQDEASCREMSRGLSHLPVQVVQASIKQLLRSDAETRFGQFDLIYSAGLFDYLNDSLGSKLMTRLGERLKHQGRLLIGNFAPGSYGYGYMELMLDWKLIYRTTADLQSLCAIDWLRVEHAHLDPFGNVAYVEWSRRAN